MSVEDKLIDMRGIINTINAFDPTRLSTVIGTAGLALHFANHGNTSQVVWPVGVESPQDVDAIGGADDLRLIGITAAESKRTKWVSHDQARDGYGDPTGQERVVVEPIDDNRLLPYSAVNRILQTNYPLTHQEVAAERVEVAGVFTLPPDVLLMSKIAAGRPKDIDSGESLFRLASDRDLLTTKASRAILAILNLQFALQRAEAARLSHIEQMH